MPYKHHNYKIKSVDDKRIKLSEHDKQQIKEMYGKLSQRKLAMIFGVSRRLIQFIGDNEKHKKNLLQRKQRGGWKQYYDKKKNTEYQKKHRRYKQELYLNGKLEVKNETNKPNDK